MARERVRPQLVTSWLGLNRNHHRSPSNPRRCGLCGPRRGKQQLTGSLDYKKFGRIHSEQESIYNYVVPAHSASKTKVSTPPNLRGSETLRVGYEDKES